MVLCKIKGYSTLGLVDRIVTLGPCSIGSNMDGYGPRHAAGTISGGFSRAEEMLVSEMPLTGTARIPKDVEGW